MTDLEEISSLYIHFPYCRHLCNYCDFYKLKKNEGDEDYFELHNLLENSYQNHQNLLHKYKFQIGKLKTIYIGGGTPSLWGASGAKFFKAFLKKNSINFENEYEFTMEMNPNHWNEEDLNEWKEVGVNRLSIGLQSVDSKHFQWLDRDHQLEDSFRTLDYLGKNNWNYSLDFLLGIPSKNGQKRDIIRELEEVLAFKPKHFSLYILNPRGNYPMDLRKAIPNDEFIREEYLKVSSYLRDQGHIHYEVSNFGLPGYESKHNLSYWNLDSVMALGPSAAGNLFSQTRPIALRYKWKVKTPEYVIEELKTSQKLIEEVYLNLRTNRGLDWKLLIKSEQSSFEGLIEMWDERGFIKEKSDRLKLSPVGFLMLDSIMDDIFLHIKKDL